MDGRKTKEKGFFLAGFDQRSVSAGEAKNGMSVL